MERCGVAMFPANIGQSRRPVQQHSQFGYVSKCRSFEDVKRCTILPQCIDRGAQSTLHCKKEWTVELPSAARFDQRLVVGQKRLNGVCIVVCDRVEGELFWRVSLQVLL